MDFLGHGNALTCRLCLCKCENARNLLEETDFAVKITELFPKIVISPENGLSTIICEYCHNTVQQFLGFYENVNANQDELMKMLPDLPKEEIFAEPIVCVDEKIEQKCLKFDVGDDENLFFNAKKATDEGRTVKNPKNKISPTLPYTKSELQNMNYFQIINLPPSFKTCFKCSLCQELCKNFSELQKHITQKHFGHLTVNKRQKEANPYLKNLQNYCNICGKLIPWTEACEKYYEHSYLHYGIQPFKCDICGFSTNEKSLVRQHMVQKHLSKIKQLGCLICKLDFDSTALRNDHMQESHPESLLPCQKCNTKFVDLQTLKMHQKQCESFQIECVRCPGGIRFPDERILGLHMQQHEFQDKYKKSFACHLCERGFESSNVFKTHLRLHEENALTPCEICGKTVNMTEGRKLPKHMESHMKEKPEFYKCDFCGEEFGKKQQLARHINKIHNRREESCYKCGQMIVMYLMSRHLKHCHAGDLKCKHCPEIFKKQSERIKHTRLVHLGYKCKRCNIQFQNKSQLEAHQRHDEYHKSKGYKAPRKKLKIEVL
ncbi:zinc finger protein 235-like [Culicoides brevitarsis]|uniref:zinc finger protein 235-like n=1 Tax=Culicoides brevitarsis TaxID=469753 RepID=UPI00307C3959